MGDTKIEVIRDYETGIQTHIKTGVEEPWIYQSQM